MNILALNWRDITHPNAGGAELNIHEILKRLIKKGHKATLFCGYYEGAKPIEVIDGIKIIRKGKFIPIYISIYFLAFFYYLKNLRKQNFDIIIEDLNGTPWFSFFYSRKPRVILVHHLVKGIFFKDINNLIGLPIISYPIALIAYIVESYLMPLLYINMKFIAVSNSTKSELIDIGIKENNIKVIYNGVDNKLKPNYKIKTKYPKIIYLGRLMNYKRLDILIRLIDNIKNKIPNIKLHIAGSGESESKLKELVKKSSLSNYVIFHGFVNNKEKIKLLQQSWLFITPSIKEGWGISVIEANACGTPSIVFDVPGLNEVILNNKTGFIVENEEELIKKVVNLLENKNLRFKMSKECYNWSKNFNWDKTAKETLNYLEEIIKPHKQ